MTEATEEQQDLVSSLDHGCRHVPTPPAKLAPLATPARCQRTAILHKRGPSGLVSNLRPYGGAERTLREGGAWGEKCRSVRSREQRLVG